MSQELKKCPCCKGPAIYNEDLNSFYAECHHCQLRTASYRTKERAAEIWNTRHDDWISIEDRLPEEDTHVLVNSHGNTSCFILRHSNKLGMWYDKQLQPWSSITHWKPITLPEVE